jgi:AcrR family transcriptional regulator
MPTQKPVPDRRIARTREALRRAFHELILEKGYDAITVNDMVERANIARSTFYAHHGSKESVLLDGIGSLREFLTTIQREASDAGNGSTVRLAFSFALFEHMDSHRDLYHAFMGDRGGAVMINAFRQMLARLVRRELSEVSIAGRKNAPVPLDAVVRFTTDSLMGVMTWWVEAKPRISAAEGNRAFRQLIEPALAANGFGPGESFPR